MYEYKCKLVRVIDGDTIVIDIDYGMDMWRHKVSVRLWGINAPEVRGPEKEKGIESREWLLNKLIDNPEFVIRTHKDKRGSFGRYLIDIWLGGVNINRQMVRDGMAVEYVK